MFTYLTKEAKSRNDYRKKVLKAQREAYALDSEQEYALAVQYPKGGHIEHYYHFLFDLVLPLFLLFRKMSFDFQFQIKPFGMLTPILNELFGNKVRVVDALPNNDFVLMGMNPRSYRIKTTELRVLKDNVFQIKNIKVNKRQNLVVLIERLPPSDYYLKDAINKGSGASRRSISNSVEFSNAIKFHLKKEYRFEIAHLEEMSFSEQLELFSSASLVIGQHGAGLSNIIWMSGGSVVELGFEGKDYFKLLASYAKLNYHCIDYEQEHITVKINDFFAAVNKNKKIMKHFVV